MRKKYCIFILMLFAVVKCSYANTHKINKQEADTVVIKNDTFINKTIPAEFAAPITEALAHYPELKNTKITWRIKNAYTPLATRPSFGSFFKAKSKRSYIITISDQTIDTLEHLLYKNLGYDEQVGIMGHELGHVVDFRSKNFLQSVRSAIGHLSSKYKDKMEYNTDMICIQHGLGEQLKKYSTYVRTKMQVHTWRGVDNVYHNDQKHERYMNPDTIEKMMHTARQN